MSDQRPDLPETDRIEAVFRNGSVTVVGVIVGFSLTFLTSWASNPLPWHIRDLYGIVPLVAGIVFQLVSLAALLRTDSLEGWRYRRAVRQFLAGLALVSVGVAIAIAVDVLAVMESAR
jgi:uncharacterized membrane protein